MRLRNLRKKITIKWHKNLENEKFSKNVGENSWPRWFLAKNFEKTSFYQLFCLLSVILPFWKKQTWSNNCERSVTKEHKKSSRQEWNKRENRTGPSGGKWGVSRSFCYGSRRPRSGKNYWNRGDKRNFGKEISMPFL